jgi:hypothetical protein
MGLSPAALLATASTFVWLGMVLAISFLEAPLKFRAPGVTVPLGLGIGKLVFRALNICETVLAVAAVLAILSVGARAPGSTALGVAVAVLVLQLAVVRRWLSRRTHRVLTGSGATAPRSRTHLVYVALEVVKAGALLTAGISIAAG